MSTQTVTASQAPPSASLIARFFSVDNRYLPPIVLTLILLVGNLTFASLPLPAAARAPVRTAGS